MKNILMTMMLSAVVALALSQNMNEGAHNFFSGFGAISFTGLLIDTGEKAKYSPLKIVCLIASLSFLLLLNFK